MTKRSDELGPVNYGAFDSVMIEGAGAATIMDGRVISVYRDPAITRYLELHKKEVQRRVELSETIQKMGEAGLFGEVEIENPQE
ncbi:MAG TPA: hypothetical protein VFW90_01555 [Candidatus Saccharimonadales bacterium]|nr:hypothetical protein [Candidatus Saccharimonadales bacterium]